MLKTGVSVDLTSCKIQRPPQWWKDESIEQSLANMKKKKSEVENETRMHCGQWFRKLKTTWPMKDKEHVNAHFIK